MLVEQEVQRQHLKSKRQYKEQLLSYIPFFHTASLSCTLKFRANALLVIEENYVRCRLKGLPLTFVSEK